MKTIEAWCVSATGDVAKVTGLRNDVCLNEEEGLRRHYCDGSWFMELKPALARATVVVERRISNLKNQLIDCHELLLKLKEWEETARE